jgi:hypothetical protein
MSITTSVGAMQKSKSKPSANSPAKSTDSCRVRVYHCLVSPQGFLRDHSDALICDQSTLWTSNPAESLRFLGQDAAAERLRQLHSLIPELTITCVNFQCASAGTWIPLDD